MIKKMKQKTTNNNLEFFLNHNDYDDNNHIIIDKTIDYRIFSSSSSLFL